MAAQSRVRRLIGRRRAGLDRYIGVLSREVGQGAPDSIDPITELLTQLSGKGMVHYYVVSPSTMFGVCLVGPNSGGGATASGNNSGEAGSGRRLITEFPPNIQQLLDQQDRQAFERGSPIRRPVYRKVIAGGGVAPPMHYDNSLPTYLLPGIVILPVLQCCVMMFALLQGHPLESPQLLKDGRGESSRGILAEPVLREAERGVPRLERDKGFLLAK